MSLDPDLLIAARQLIDADGIVVWQLESSSELNPAAASWRDAASPVVAELRKTAHHEIPRRFLEDGRESAVQTFATDHGPVSAVLVRCRVSDVSLIVGTLWFDLPDRVQQVLELLLPAISHAGPHSSDESPHTEFRQFCRVIHQSVDLHESGQLITNEACLLSQADRVAVAVLRGARVQLLAASGTEAIMQRAQESRLLTGLCQTVLQTGQVVEWSTASPDAPESLEERLSAYIQATHLRSASLIPLFSDPPISRDDDPKYAHHRNETPRPLGVLVFEQYTSAEITTEERLLRNQMSGHVAAALTNSRLHSSILFRRPLLAVGRLLAWFRGRRLALAGLVASLLTAFILCCVFVPWEYKVTCDGVLITTTRHDVFAPEAGLVDRVLVEHNSLVTAGQPLLQLRNDELEARQAVAESRVSELRKLARSYALQMNEADRRGDRDAAIRLQGDVRRTEIELIGARKSLTLINARLAGLTVRAPANGRVATFQLKQELLNRPVTRGDRLLQVYPPRGPWTLELNVPEYRSGYVRQAMRGTRSPDVEFILATHVELTRFARLADAGSIIERTEDQGTVLIVRAPVRSPESLPALSYGSECHARIHCGTHTLGWCLFGDVVEFLQRHFWI